MIRCCTVIRKLYKIPYKIIKAAEYVSFDVIILEIKFLFFTNTVKILKFR